MYDTILVPTDGSRIADGAIDRALDLADRFDATIHALYVVDTERASGAGFGEDLGVDAEHVIEQLREEGETAVGEVADDAAARGVDCRTVIREGTPHEVIREYAAENGVDCIVMGTHGRTGIDRFLLGSTTERVLRHADVPVLTVRRDAAVE
ncbi:MAG: universal stress protein [Haloarculaceae archaeon]